VTFNAGGTTPAGTWPDTRTVEGRTIHSAVAGVPDASAGSGGPEHELRAWESARGGHVAYVQRVQSEGEPDFGLIWAIIEGTKPPS
jgi:hypothetical protein